MNTPADLITTQEARVILQCSRQKMTNLIKEGYLRHFPNPLDKREKLVSEAEVRALQPKRRRAA